MFSGRPKGIANAATHSIYSVAGHSVGIPVAVESVAIKTLKFMFNAIKI